MPSLARSLRLAALSLGVCVACSPRSLVPAPQSQPVVSLSPSASLPAPIVAPEPAAPTREEAVRRGRELAEAWRAGPRYDAEGRGAWLRELGLEDAGVRRLLELIARECLAQRESSAAICQPKDDGPESLAQTTEALIELLAELADVGTPGGPSVRLLVRLDARGVWQAGSAIERVLERRMLASLRPCTPPTPVEVAATRSGLGDLALVEPRDSPAKGLVARWPTASELDDLARLYAVVGEAGPEVGSEEDRSAPPLPTGHPDLATRARLRAEARTSLLDGNLEHHLRAVETYLATLGYPRPLRLAEEADERWGGADASFLLREAATSAEILGRDELAEALYRRAQPGGGACGTSTASRRAGQLRGIIRTGERARGCRAIAVERLFSVKSGTSQAYGVERLSTAGFEVAALYAAAIRMAGREDRVELERALQALPSRSGEALARLERFGPEAWAKRLRAVPGYADAAQGAGLGLLLTLSERGAARAEAVETIGLLAEDHGWNPCIRSATGRGWGSSSSREARVVRNAMRSCRTRIEPRAIDDAVKRLAASATDPSPELREAIAVALGRLGSPKARRALRALERDAFRAAGKICTSEGAGPLVCGPSLPVARAARAALEALARADALRAEQRRTPLAK